MRGLPDLCTKMRRPQKNDPETKNEAPPDFYRLSKLSPLPGGPPNHRHLHNRHVPRPSAERVVTAVAHSPSLSSVSCEAAPPPNVYSDGQQSPARSSRSTKHATQSARHEEYSAVDSWDQHDASIERKQSEEVAVNLSDVYDRESNGSGGKTSQRKSAKQLSDADLHYLIQQNRALLQEAHEKEAQLENDENYR